MSWLLSPPMALVVLALLIWLLLAWSGRLAAKGKPSYGKGEPYACGQDVPTGRIQPSYGFYPVAFFFTIIHVTALMLGTVPKDAVYWAIPLLLIVAAAIAILFRKDDEDDEEELGE